MTTLPAFLEDPARDVLVRAAQEFTPGSDTSSFSVQFFTQTVTGPIAHHQVYRQGTLWDWVLGPLDGARWAVQHASAADAERFVLGNSIGAAGCKAATIVQINDEGGWDEFACPPGHLADARAATGWPPVPGADLTVNVAVSATPFGLLHYELEFSGGGLSRWAWGHASHADVAVALPMTALVSHHLGELDLIEMLGHPQAEVQGEWPKLMLAAGLLDSVEFGELFRAGCAVEAASALARLGEILSSDGWARVRQTAEWQRDNLDEGRGMDAMSAGPGHA